MDFGVNKTDRPDVFLCASFIPTMEFVWKTSIDKTYAAVAAPKKQKSSLHWRTVILLVCSSKHSTHCNSLLLPGHNTIRARGEKIPLLLETSQAQMSQGLG